MEQLEQLKEENRRLREENARLADQKKGKGLSCWLWGLIIAGVGVVGIAVLAILAAIALPMYSTFKQKSKVGASLQSLQGTKPALMTWYDDNGTFTGIEVPTVSGAVMAGGVRVGAGLSKVEGCTYRVISTEGTAEDDTGSISIGFAWEQGSGCPKVACDGVWTLTCSKSDDSCAISVTAGDGSLGMNIP